MQSSKELTDQEKGTHSIRLQGVKEKFSIKFPDSQLSPILLSEPDELHEGEFLAKVGTWLAVLDTEKKRGE